MPTKTKQARKQAKTPAKKSAAKTQRKNPQKRGPTPPFDTKDQGRQDTNRS